MPFFLAKSDPQVYSIDHLKADRRTSWDGVRNPQAVQAIRAMQPNDWVLIYHSGGESALVGIARVVSAPRDDPRDPKSAVVDVEYYGRIDPPVTLREVKASGLFADFALVRQSRLSAMPVPSSFIAWLRKQRPKVLPEE